MKSCVNKLDECFQMGLISKSELEESRRAWNEASKDMWSEDRDSFVEDEIKRGEISKDVEYVVGIGAD